MVYGKYDCSSCYCDLSRSAAAYLIKAKRSGVKCIGCPAGGNCSSKNKKKKKEIDGSGHRKENHVYYRNAL